jgi:putative ABC transport system permease protein
MNFVTRLIKRCSLLFRRERFHGELDEEMAFHRAQLQKEFESAGIAPMNARHAAARQFGNAERHKERSHEVVGFRWESIFEDLRYAIRQLRRSPGFTIVILLTLAIGIGANTLIFSVTDALMLKPLPYKDADRLAILWLRSPGIGIPQDWPSPGQYHDIKAQNRVFDETAIAIGEGHTLTGLSKAMKVDGIEASSSLLPMFDAKPLLGRIFLPEEDRPGGHDTVVLTYGLWKQAFGGDTNIVGRTITLDAKPRIVIGVLPQEFKLNHEVVPTIGGIDKPEIFLPLPMDAKQELDYGPEDFNILARLKPGVTMEQAQSDIGLIAERHRVERHRDASFTISVVPLIDQVVGNVRSSVLILLGAVGLVLLIACTNVANLLLSRAAGRQKEIALRTALGAGRMRLVMQLLTESVLLSLLGGVAGLGLSACGLIVVRRIHPGNIPRLDEMGLDFRVLIFTLGISLLTGIAFGLAPALRSSRVDLVSTLKAGGRSSSGGGLSVRHDKLRGALVIAELAVSLTLLAGAGLLIRSFVQLLKVPPGFKPDGVVSMQVSASGPEYKDHARRIQFYETLSQRVHNLPGVTGEGIVSTLPLTASVSWGGMQIEGYVPPANQPELQVDMRDANAEYFQTMQIPLEAGRLFASTDTEKSQPVALVDEKMAKRFWPKGDAIGKRIRHGDQSRWLTVVGVVGLVKQYGLDIDTRMVVYFPHSQAPDGTMFVVARTTGDAAQLANSVVEQVHGIDQNVPVFDVATMQERVHDSVARQRFAMTMLGAFAGFAMILAAIGVYGVMSFLVTQGTSDIAIRMALGARRESILSLVFQQGMALALIGIAAGLAGAFCLTRVMSTLLFGVSSTDPLTYAGVVALLTLATLAACYFPARRAMRVDPMVALRYE